ncbi:MAG: InlB B-repeat-containing protein [Spirochaetales bacterium]|nr:InlB B-repeat-containing protein [Spirochaetales bacterium]
MKKNCLLVFAFLFFLFGCEDPKEISITYDLDGASGTTPVDSVIYQEDELVKVASVTNISRNENNINLVFIGWNTQKDGKGTLYKPGQTIEVRESLTLYPQWTSLGALSTRGGVVFYDKGEVTNGWQYLEAAPYDVRLVKDLGFGNIWGESILCSANNDFLSSGRFNTFKIFSNDRSTRSIDSIGSFSDWYIPSKTEIELLYEKKSIFENILSFDKFKDGIYWTSTEISATEAWAFDFRSGKAIKADKKSRFLLRPIRAFQSDKETLIAMYEKDEFSEGNLPFDSNFYQVKDSILLSGDSEDLNREGYSLIGWILKNNSKKYRLNDKISAPNFGSLVFIPDWEKNSCKIIFDKNNEFAKGRMSDQTLLADTSTRIKANSFTNLGHTFAGWSLLPEGEVEYLARSSITVYSDTLTLFAIWEVVTYTINFVNTKDPSQIITQSVKYGESVKLKPNSFSVDGYDFLGWSDSASGSKIYDDQQDYTMGAKSVYLYTVWDANEFQVIFNKNNDNATGEMAELVIKNGKSENLSANTFALDGYSFSGWSLEKSGTVNYNDKQSFLMGPESVTLYAVWTANDYNIIFNKNDDLATGSMDSQSVTFNSQVKICRNTFSKTGWSFKGWAESSTGSVVYQDGSNYILNSLGAELFAIWEPSTFSVSFNANHLSATGSMTDVSGLYESSVTLPSCDFSNSGYLFAGWSISREGDVTFADEASFLIGSSDSTLYARWSLIEYSIDYVLNEGVLVDPRETFNIETETFNLETPTRDHYEFSGWYSNSIFNGASVSSISQGSVNNKTFYAKWEPKNYSINYVLGEGTGNENRTSYTFFTPTFALTPATRTGYDFSGWYSNSNFEEPAVIEITQGSSGAKTLYAKWSPVQYSITYELNGGEGDLQPTSYTTESATFNLSNPTREHYTFDGWYLDEEFTSERVVSLAKGNSGHKIFYAKWVPVEYTINYYSEGQISNTNPTSYNIETPTIGINIPSRNGYTFGGWFDNSKFEGSSITSIPKGSFGEKNFYAKWEVATYSITYNLNGGSLDTDILSYTVFTPTFSLPIPTHSEHSFDDWYDSSSFENPVSRILVGSFGDKNFYAKWLKKNVITFETYCDDNYEDQLVLDGEKIRRPLNPTKVDHAFVGWFVSEEATEPFNFNSSIYSDINLVARWRFEPFSYEILYNNTIYISKYNGDAAEVTVPSEIDGYPVTSVADQTFAGNINIKKVTFPLSVTDIYGGPFSDCSNLETVILPSNLKKIDRYFFSNCVKLKNVTLPSSITSIGNYAFSGCSSLKSIDLPEKLESIGNYAFFSATSLEHISFKSSLTSIGYSAFKDCTSLKSVYFSRIKNIGAGAFENCISLGKVDMLYPVSRLGAEAFKGCTSLTTAYLAGSFDTLSSSVFMDCYSLVEVILPDSLTNIQRLAFYNCTGLEKITIPANVSVMMGAFGFCSKLKEVIFNGNAPSQFSYDFSNVHPDFKIFYYQGKSGWSNPWNGYPTQAINNLSFVASSSTYYFKNVLPVYRFPAGPNDSIEKSVPYYFQVAETEVSYELWKIVYDWATSSARGDKRYTFGNTGRMGSHGGTSEPTASSMTNKHPVTMVSYLDTLAWCNALTEWHNFHKNSNFEPVYRYGDQIIRNVTLYDSSIIYNNLFCEANGFRLPTASEWELVSRYASSRLSYVLPGYSNPWFSVGNSASGDGVPHSNSYSTDLVAWSSFNSNTTGRGAMSQPCGQKKFNSLDLRDVTGNVWELVYHENRSFLFAMGGAWDSIFISDLAHYSSKSISFGEVSNNTGFRLFRTP